ncbi:hypothetical protein DIPPA_31685 [Diplonema papillatum]|nr:hypothetical protein DIPPA_31685 [Diplonema papillatum]
MSFIVFVAADIFGSKCNVEVRFSTKPTLQALRERAQRVLRMERGRAVGEMGIDCCASEVEIDRFQVLCDETGAWGVPTGSDCLKDRCQVYVIQRGVIDVVGPIPHPKPEAVAPAASSASPAEHPLPVQNMGEHQHFHHRRASLADSVTEHSAGRDQPAHTQTYDRLPHRQAHGSPAQSNPAVAEGLSGQRDYYASLAAAAPVQCYDGLRADSSASGYPPASAVQNQGPTGRGESRQEYAAQATHTQYPRASAVQSQGQAGWVESRPEYAAQATHTEHPRASAVQSQGQAGRVESRPEYAAQATHTQYPRASAVQSQGQAGWVESRPEYAAQATHTQYPPSADSQDDAGCRGVAAGPLAHPAARATPGPGPADYSLPRDNRTAAAAAAPEDLVAQLYGKLPAVQAGGAFESLVDNLFHREAAQPPAGMAEHEYTTVGHVNVPQRFLQPRSASNSAQGPRSVAQQQQQQQPAEAPSVYRAPERHHTAPPVQTHSDRTPQPAPPQQQPQQLQQQQPQQLQQQQPQPPSRPRLQDVLRHPSRQSFFGAFDPFAERAGPSLLKQARLSEITRDLLPVDALRCTLRGNEPSGSLRSAGTDMSYAALVPP